MPTLRWFTAHVDDLFRITRIVHHSLEQPFPFLFVQEYLKGLLHRNTPHQKSQMPPHHRGLDLSELTSTVIIIIIIIGIVQEG